jgi:hypothetical protein
LGDALNATTSGQAPSSALKTTTSLENSALAPTLFFYKLHMFSLNYTMKPKRAMTLLAQCSVSAGFIEHLELICPKGV